MKYPVKIEQIENIEEWRKDFHYPLKRSETDEFIIKAITPLMLQIFDLFKTEEKVIFRIASSYIYIEIFNLYLKLLLARKFNDLDPRLDEKDNSRLILLIRKQYADYPFILFETPRLEKLTFRGVASKFKQLIKKKLKPLKTEGVELLLCGWNPTTLKIAEKYNKEMVRIDQSDYMSKVYKGTLSGERENILAEKSSELVAQSFENVTKKRLPVEIVKSFAKSFAYFLMQIQFDYKQSCNFVKKSKFARSPLLLTGAGGYPTRILSEAVRKIGGKVIGTPHGGGTSGAKFKDLTWVEFMTCDKIACLSPKEVEDYQKHVIPEINEMQFPVFYELEDSILEVKEFDYSHLDFSRIKNIMHIGMGLRGDEFFYGIPSDIHNLDLELKIIDYFIKFKHNNYFFKTRPKSQHLESGFDHGGYYGNKVKYVNKPLSEVLDKADIFIAEYIGSYALWEVMTMTDKPIILFKPPLPECYPSFMDSVAKRCFIVDQFEDEHNRLSFNTDKLDKLLSNEIDL